MRFAEYKLKLVHESMSSCEKRLHGFVREQQQYNTHFAHVSTTIPKLKTFSLQFLAVVYTLLFCN